MEPSDGVERVKVGLVGQAARQRVREHPVLVHQEDGDRPAVPSVAASLGRGRGENGGGLGRKHVLASIDASLERLGLDYVDLYQIHRWDPRTPI